MFKFEKSFVTNCSSRHVECSFDNPAELRLLKAQNFLAQIKKIFHKIVVFINFKMFLWRRRDEF